MVNNSYWISKVFILFLYLFKLFFEVFVCHSKMVLNVIYIPGKHFDAHSSINLKKKNVFFSPFDRIHLFGTQMAKPFNRWPIVMYVTAIFVVNDFLFISYFSSLPFVLFAPNTIFFPSSVHFVSVYRLWRNQRRMLDVKNIYIYNLDSMCIFVFFCSVHCKRWILFVPYALHMGSHVECQSTLYTRTISSSLFVIFFTLLYFSPMQKKSSHTHWPMC